MEAVKVNKAKLIKDHFKKIHESVDTIQKIVLENKLTPMSKNPYLSITQTEDGLKIILIADLIANERK